jgi:uncharacterized membrane protein
MGPDASLLILLIVIGLIATAIFAINAYLRTSKLEKLLGEAPQQISRIYALEQATAHLARLPDLDRRLTTIDQKIDKLLAGATVAAPPATSVSTPAAPPTASPAPIPPHAVEPTPPVHPPAPVAPPSPVPPVASPMATPPARTPAPSTPASSVQVTAAHVATVRSSTSSPLLSKTTSRSGSDMEELIAGHWLNYVGILAMAIAIAFFLKYAFDNNWIGPSGRVAIGVLIGTAMFPLSHWQLKRGYTYFSEGIAGLGAAVLYLSVWAGWHYYQLFQQNTAFILMILVTAAMSAVAITRDSERIALLALIGGALTPILVSTGHNEEMALFTYIAILGLGMLGIAFQRKWASLPRVQFIATLLYFWGWYNEFYSPRALDETLFFATVFFALFTALPLVRSIQGEEFAHAEIAIVLSNASQYLIALRLMLWPGHRWNLTFALVALAATHFAAAEMVARRTTGAARAAKLVYTGLAVAFLTLAVPSAFDDEWMTIAWAVEGALVIWSGLRVRAAAFRALGFVLFLVVAVRLMSMPIHADPVFLLNARFLTQSLCAAAFLAAFVFAQRSDVELSSAETNAYYLLAIAANFLFLVTLSLEVWDLYGRTSLAMDRALAQQLALSVLWVVYALALMLGGVKWKSAALRWQALVLLGVAIAKVFFFDLSFLTRFYRIVSFFVLGLVLLLVSFFYQRRSAAAAGDKSA